MIGKPHPRELFTADEDIKLIKLVQLTGVGKWKLISSYFPNRNSRQCKERWNNFLNPDINKKPWTEEEDKLLFEKYEEFGSQWKVISTFFNQRTHISLRNRMMKLKRHMKSKEKSEDVSFMKFENESDPEFKIEFNNDEEDVFGNDFDDLWLESTYSF